MQKIVSLSPRPKGIHLVTDELLSMGELSTVRVGLLHLHLLHTSAGLCLNENASPEVRVDLELWFEEAVPFTGRYQHSEEGFDDMPAHIKTILTGSSLTIPISDGKPMLGPWQGIYLCEFRLSAGSRNCVLTIAGSD
jgi:secondary thiamine-phosphate synthase enzyme